MPTTIKRATFSQARQASCVIVLSISLLATTAKAENKSTVQCSGLFDQIAVWSGDKKNCNDKKTAPRIKKIEKKQDEVILEEKTEEKPLENNVRQLAAILPTIPHVTKAPLPLEKPTAFAQSETATLEMKGQMHPQNGTQTLAQIVDRTVSDHPLIAMQFAKIDELREAVKVAASGKSLQAEIRVGTGHGTAGSLKNDTTLFGQNDLSSALRADAAISLKQLVYDFNGLNNEILKNRKILTAEEYKSLDKIEEITLKVAQSYLKITEQRELLAAAERNIASLNKIMKLISQNATEGNATIVDVKRVKARQVEAESQRTDLSADLMLAKDQFKRLAKIEAETLALAPTFANKIPADRQLAVTQAIENSPRLLSFHHQNASMVNELNAQIATSRPKVQAEAEAGTKNYLGNTNPHSEADIRAMVAMRYKFLDGGQNKALELQIKARQEQGVLRQRHEEEEVEADIRQFYNALIAARAKINNLNLGLETNTKVQALYIEQFLGGKRTLFELLDSQQQLYQSRRAVITNQFEERRSIYGILRSMGRLTQTILDDGKKQTHIAGIPKKPNHQQK